MNEQKQSRQKAYKEFLNTKGGSEINKYRQEQANYKKQQD